MKGKITQIALPAEDHVVAENVAAVKKWHKGSCTRPDCKVWVEAIGPRDDRALVLRHGVARVLPRHEAGGKPIHTIVIGQSGRSYSILHVNGCPEPVYTCPVAAAAREQLDLANLGREPGRYRCHLNARGQLRISQRRLDDPSPEDAQ